MNKEDVWERVLETLRGVLPETVIKAWFDDTYVSFLDEGRIVIAAPTDFKRDALSKRYEGSIARALFHIFNRSYRVEIVTLVKSESGSQTTAQSEVYTFDSFVVGPTNQFAHAAALAVANNPGKSYNPLFIYGGSGLGKTHLLYAIRNHIKRTNPDLKICMINAEQFFSELVRAIETNNRAVFTEKYRKSDILLVDDIQFIAKKDFVQEEFFHTFNTLHESGRQIVLVSDRPPRDMRMLEERLRSRFEWGLVVDIQPPDLETRMAILRFKAQGLGLPMPDTVSQHIAETVTTNVRQLEGTVKKLFAYYDLMGYNVDVETATRAISDLMKEMPGLNPTPELILKSVCTFYGVEEKDVIGSSRRANIVQARQTSMFLMREIIGKSYHEIAEVLNRDHSTVIYSIDRINEQKKDNADFQNELKIITENIRAE